VSQSISSLLPSLLITICSLHRVSLCIDVATDILSLSPGVFSPDITPICYTPHHIQRVLPCRFRVCPRDVVASRGTNTNEWHAGRAWHLFRRRCSRTGRFLLKPVVRAVPCGRFSCADSTPQFPAWWSSSSGRPKTCSSHGTAANGGGSRKRRRTRQGTLKRRRLGLWNCLCEVLNRLLYFPTSKDTFFE